MMTSSLLHFDVIHFYPLPSLCPPFLLVFVLSVNVLDGGLSPGEHHYSHFLCNVNDGNPLFISDLLITPQPIAYPPRQGSHSHSRHYFIRRARLLWAVVNGAVIMQVGCMQWLSSSLERRGESASLLLNHGVNYHHPCWLQKVSRSTIQRYFLLGVQHVDAFIVYESQ